MDTENRSKVFIERQHPWGDYFGITLARQMRDGQWAVMQEAAFKVVNENEQSSPAFSISRDDAQAFMDELWHVGIRPTEGSGSAGSLAATERHLNDMQRIVFRDFPKV
jgi:hypothetical protein